MKRQGIGLGVLLATFKAYKYNSMHSAQIQIHHGKNILVLRTHAWYFTLQETHMSQYLNVSSELCASVFGLYVYRHAVDYRHVVDATTHINLDGVS